MCMQPAGALPPPHLAGKALEPRWLVVGIRLAERKLGVATQPLFSAFLRQLDGPRDEWLPEASVGRLGNFRPADVSVQPGTRGAGGGGDAASTSTANVPSAAIFSEINTGEVGTRFASIRSIVVHDQVEPL